MITTIAKYINDGNVIFNTSLTSLDYMDATIINYLTYILKYRHGKNNIFSDNETDIQTAVLSMFAVNNDRYTALYNIDKLVSPTDEYRETKTNTGTVTDTNTGTVTNTDTGTQTDTNTGTVTNTDTGTQTDTNTGTVTTEVTPETVATNLHSENTADNGTLRARYSDVSSSTGSDTSERTDNLTHRRTDDLTHERTDDLTHERTDDLTHERTDDLTHERTDDLTEIRTGYNNKFANADFILNLARNNLYDAIIDDVIHTIVIPVYNIDELEV